MKSMSVKTGLVVLALFLGGISCPSAAKSEVFVLEGLEIAKGIDIGSIRIGTSFAGKVLDASGTMDLGFWSATLSHRGAGNIEVCGGTNDIVSLRLVICFTGGDYAGHQLVLGMTDLKRIPDVYWNFDYAGVPCELGGFSCDACSPLAARIPCSEGASNLAVIGDIALVPSRGSTLKSKSARLTEGQLCHYFPIIPRVYGKLDVVF